MSRLIRSTRSRILSNQTQRINLTLSPNTTLINARALYSTVNPVSRDESDSTLCSAPPLTRTPLPTVVRIENASPEVTSSNAQPRNGPWLRIHSSACEQASIPAKDRVPGSSSSPSSKVRNNQPWTREDDTKLMDMRQQGHTWKDIGFALGRSRQACNRRFDAHLDPRFGLPTAADTTSTLVSEGSSSTADSLSLTKTYQPSSFWEEDPERIEILKNMAREGIAWKDIALELGDIKASACEKQWRLLRRQSHSSISPSSFQDQEGKDTHGSSSSDIMSDPNTKQSHQPSIQFRRADVELLKSAVHDYGMDQWDHISTEVFQSQFSGSLLRRQYTQIERRRRVWTDAQERTLVRLVQERTPCPFTESRIPASKAETKTPTTATKVVTIDDISDEQWEFISRDVPGEHTGEECRRRWLTLGLNQSRKLYQEGSNGGRMTEVDPTNKEDSYPTKDLDKPLETARKRRVTWTREQTQKLESIIESMRALGDNNYYLYRRNLALNHNNKQKDSRDLENDGSTMTCFNNNSIQDGLLDWSLIADEMRDETTGEIVFTKTQCKSRWTRLLREQAPAKKSGSWEEEELEALIRGLMEKGPQWTEIQQAFVPGRSPTFIQGKWKTIRTKIQKNMIIQRISWDQAAMELFGDRVGAQMELLVKKRPNLCLD